MPKKKSVKNKKRKNNLENGDSYLAPLSAVSFNMDTQNKKTNPNSSFVTKQFGFARFGGAEGSRTPVRKSIHTAFSERRLSFIFPSYTAVSQAAQEVSVLCMTDTTGKISVHVHH